MLCMPSVCKIFHVGDIDHVWVGAGSKKSSEVGQSLKSFFVWVMFSEFRVSMPLILGYLLVSGFVSCSS
jgi:hypothetical protein